MKFPTLIVDNFFNDPTKVKNYAHSINDYTIAEDGRWPGKRSKLLHEINYSLFSSVCTKIISTLYPIGWKKIYYIANQYFQLIKIKDYDLGFIHQDSEACDLTAIIYLSSHKDCGTNLFSLKKEYFFKDFDENYINKKYLFYKDPSNLKKRKEALDVCIKNNSIFEESLSINSKFNRLVLFDANHFHSSQSFKDVLNKEEDRLILITFFKKLYMTDMNEDIKYHLLENSNII
jgi:hypothetical protein